MSLFKSIFGSKNKKIQQKHEASMNFDLENVHPFLTDLENKFKFGININNLNEFAKSVEVESEKSIETEITYSGQTSLMEFRVFMDDIDAPDLYLFFESVDLADSVGDFMMEWAEARGM